MLVKVYCNRKNLSFLDKDNIVKSNIMDEEQNTYLVKINKISNEKKSHCHGDVHQLGISLFWLFKVSF